MGKQKARRPAREKETSENRASANPVPSRSASRTVGSHELRHTNTSTDSRLYIHMKSSGPVNTSPKTSRYQSACAENVACCPFIEFSRLDLTLKLHRG